MDKLDKLRIGPREAGKPLTGRLRGRWSARVEVFRIIYTIEGSESHETVIIRAIGHRSSIYG